MHENNNDKDDKKKSVTEKDQQQQDNVVDPSVPEKKIDSDTDQPKFPDEISEAEMQARLAQLEDEIKQTAESMTESEDDSGKQPIDEVDEVEPVIDEAAIDAAVAEEQTRQQAEFAARREALKADDQKFSKLELADDEAGGSEQLTCMNCKTPLNGPYCHECGQPVRHFIRFFPKVLWEMINEAFDLDSKIFRTLMPLFFRPGRLTMEYIAGRRARYVNPLRLYIITSIVFFIAISVLTNFQDNLVVSDSDAGVKSRTLVSDDPETNSPETKTPPDETADTELTLTEEISAEVAAELLAEQEAKAAKRFEEVKQGLAELKKRKAEGIPIPQKLIDKIELALEDGQVDDAELESFDFNLGDFNVTTDSGGEWHPQDNPFQFNNWFAPQTTQDLNDFMWELKQKLISAQEDPRDLVEEVFNNIPQLMFILLPLFALLLKIMYIFKKRYYMEHLIVALHSHSFIFFSGITILVMSKLLDIYGHIDWLESTLSLLIFLVSFWIPINLFLQQKRIYAQGKFFTTIKFVLIGISYLVLLLITMGAAFVLGLVSI